jgi:hypothetical protein
MWIIFLYPVVLGVKQFVNCCKITNKTFTNLDYPFSCLPLPFLANTTSIQLTIQTILCYTSFFFFWWVSPTPSHTYTHFLFGSFLCFLTSILIFLSHYAHLVNIAAFSQPNSCSHKEWLDWLSNLNLSFNRATLYLHCSISKHLDLTLWVKNSLMFSSFRITKCESFKIFNC